MSPIPLEQSATILQEMMTHPALFSHLKPQKIAIIGDKDLSILKEAQKHTHLQEIWFTTADSSVELRDDDARITFCAQADLVTKLESNSLDVIIIADTIPTETFAHYFQLLTTDGVLSQLGDSPFHVQALKKIQEKLKAAGFKDIQTLQFPQPDFASGWRSAMMAKKQGIFRKIREKDIFNKTFQTHYYNFDVHKAALVLPEFMRHELAF